MQKLTHAETPYHCPLLHFVTVQHRLCRVCANKENAQKHLHAPKPQIYILEQLTTIKQFILTPTVYTQLANVAKHTTTQR